MARPFWKTTTTYAGCGNSPDGNSHVNIYITTRYRVWRRTDEVTEIESSGPCPSIAPKVSFYKTSSFISDFLVNKIENDKGEPASIIERVEGGTGGWRWTCDNDSSKSGISPTKRDAKNDAKESCGKGNYSIGRNDDIQIAKKEFGDLAK